MAVASAGVMDLHLRGHDRARLGRMLNPVRGLIDATGAGLALLAAVGVFLPGARGSPAPRSPPAALAARLRAGDGVAVHGELPVPLRAVASGVEGAHAAPRPFDDLRA